MATTITTGRSSATSLGTWLRDVTRDFREDLQRRRTYRQTYAQLNGLSDRDLQDIGVSRLSIGDIARDAAYGR